MPKLTQFSLPVPAGTSISSEYGSRKIGEAQFHYGIDFAVSNGTIVRSAGSGKVIRTIENNQKFGKVVIIEHAPDQATLYAHLSRIDVIEGRNISASSSIGLSGNTGEASHGPHLHFETIEGSANINKIKAKTDSTTGISGRIGRLNPRQFFDYYPAEIFPSEIKVGASSFGLVEGDKRDNKITGNSNANDMSGLAGFDTYEVGLGDTITDSDGNGLIVFKETGSAKKITLTGNAIPRRRAAGIIAGQWILNDLMLIKDGSDLVILKTTDAAGLDDLSGDALSSRLATKAATTLRITNFPLDKKAFGITLGKAHISNPTYASDYDTTYQYGTNIAGGGIFPTIDKRDTFTAITKKSTGESYVATFDSAGNKLEEVSPFVDPVDIAVAYNYYDSTGREHILLPFTAISDGARTAVGIARLDGDSGKVVASRIVAETSNPQEFLNLAWTGISSVGSTYLFEYQINRVSGGFSKMTQVIDPKSLVNIGAVNSYIGESGGHSTGFDKNYPAITLASGEKIILSDYKNLEIKSPKLRDMTSSEIPIDASVSSGSYSLSSAPQQLISFEVDTESTLKISPVNSQAIAISGLPSSAASKIDLTDFNLTPEELSARTFTTTAAKYSLEELLAGKFVEPEPAADDIEPAASSSARRLVKANLRGLQTSNSSEASSSNGGAGGSNDTLSDDYYYADDGYEEPIDAAEVETSFLDTAQEYSVILLPNNQTLIFTDIKAANLTQNIAQFFTLEAPSLSATASESNSATTTKTPTITAAPTSTPTVTTSTPPPNPTAEPTPQVSASAETSPEVEESPEVSLDDIEFDDESYYDDSNHTATWSATESSDPSPIILNSPYISQTPIISPPTSGTITSSPAPTTTSLIAATGGAFAIAGGGVATQTLAGAISAGLVGVTALVAGTYYFLNHSEMGQRLRNRVTNLFKRGREVHPTLQNTATISEAKAADDQQPIEVKITQETKEAEAKATTTSTPNPVAHKALANKGRGVGRGEVRARAVLPTDNE